MPLLNINIRGAELNEGEVEINLPRAYKFTELKLQHIYHNIDSQNLTSNSKNDGTNACLLYIKLGGLCENHKQIETYAGLYENFVAKSQPNVFSSDDYQLGHGTLDTNNANSASSGVVSHRYEPDVKFFNLIPIGASRHGGRTIISRDIFKTLHKGGIMDFSGELKFSLHFLDSTGDLKLMDGDTGGFITNTKKKDKFVSFISLLFEYEEA